MVDFFRPSLPVLLVVLPIVLAWRAWLNSDPKTLAGWRKPVFSSALYVASTNVVLSSGLWFYFWATPFSGIEIIRLALFLGFPVSAAAIALLVIGRGKGWWLAAGSSAITLSGWMVAYRSLSN
jgi:hypothetical protein